MNIPIDIKLNILEYAGQSWILNIADKDIIERIQYYDKSFDYPIWLSQIAKKKEFIERTNTSKLRPLYEYISKYADHIYWSNKTLRVFIKDHSIPITRRICDFLRWLYPNMRCRMSSENTIDIDGIDSNQVYEELMIIHQRYSNRNYYAWNNVINSKSTTNSVIAIAYIQHLPYNLSDMLRYSLWKNRQIRLILKNKEYPLYRALKAYDIYWDFGHKGDVYTLYIDRHEELNNIINNTYKGIVTNIEFFNDRYEITHIREPELLKIDKFFHPYIPTNGHI